MVVKALDTATNEIFQEIRRKSKPKSSINT